MKKLVLLFVLLQLGCKSFAQPYFWTHGSVTPSSSGTYDGTYTYSMTPLASGGTCHDQVSALWCGAAIDFTRSFTVEFEAMFDINPDPYVDAADGIVVVFGQNIDPTSTGPVGMGGSIGYLNSPAPAAFERSFGVELDDHNNSPYDCDIIQDHINIDKESDACILGYASAVSIRPSGSTVKDGTWRSYKIVWDIGTKTLLVYCNCNLRVIRYYDFSSVFTTPSNVHWGFTASTGGQCGYQNVRNITATYLTPATASYTICQNQCPQLLTAPVLTGTVTTSYYWSTGATIATINAPCTVGTNVYSSISYNYSTIEGAGSCDVSLKTYSVTIKSAPAITGGAAVCIGSTTQLSDAEPSGTWSCTPTTKATINATGLVTGVSAGTATVSYFVPDGCIVTTTITINPLPFIEGPSSVCTGSSITLSSSGGSGSWTSSSETIATVTPSGGTVTGVSPGTDMITYSISATGCYAVHTVTVNASPAAISGPSEVCVGSTIQLSDATSGGTWSCSSSTIATITSTGLVSGVNSGTATVTYGIDDGCTVTKTITVNGLPDEISGPSQVCVGNTITCIEPLGGNWSSSNTAIATVTGSVVLIWYYGTVGGVTPGVVNISYTIAATGCYATKSVTVNPTPTAISASATEVCQGSAIYLSDGLAGGTWSSNNITIATVDGSGEVTGLSAGGVIITYETVGGCYATVSVTVNPLPPISGASQVCVGSSITLSTDVPFGSGTWSSSNMGVATVVAGSATTGIVTGVSPGDVTISYTVPVTGCITTHTVTVNPLPGTISGPTEVCRGSTITLSDPTPGGTWSSDNTDIATVGATTGDVTGVYTGAVNISYTLSTGCFTTYSVTVNDTPVVDISNTTPVVYQGCSLTLIGTVTGPETSLLWSSSNTLVATVSPTTTITTVLTGGTPGTSVITFSAFNECGSGNMSIIATVLPIPVLTLTAPAPICTGNTVTLSSPTGDGTWSSSNISVATVTLTGGVVTGVTAGTSIITYTANLGPGGCSTIATTTVTVNETPAITGYFAICEAAGTTTLSDNVPGGTWSTGNTDVATVDPATGVVTAVSTTGSAVITYTSSGGCIATATVAVLAGAPECVCNAVAGNPSLAGLIQELDPGHTGYLTSSPTAGGYYYLNHDVVVAGGTTITMTNNVVVISPSVTITVWSGGKISLEHSHLFCCPGHMWNGIQLNMYVPTGGGGLGPCGQLSLTNNAYGSTLIEDAKIAVQLQVPNYMDTYDPTTATTADMTLYSNGAIFNKDSIGVLVAGLVWYPSLVVATPGAVTDEHPGYPVEIQNTVFTCRNFYAYPYGSGWPFSWPDNNTGPGALKTTITTTTPYLSPYNVTTYGTTTCNNGYGAAYGIAWYYTGATDPGIGTGSEVYFSGVVGSQYPVSDIAASRNIFDNMTLGIAGENSNILVRNSAFMNLSGGIYSFRDAYGATDGDLYKLDVYGNASGYNNEFYDCGIGVDAEDLYNVRGIFSDMRSSHNTTSPGGSLGAYGYLVTSPQYYHIELSHNTISNVYTGISSHYVAPIPGESVLVGQMSINGNTLQAALGGTSATTYKEYMHLAIDAEAEVAMSNIVVGAEVNTDTNTINYVYNGILLSGWSGDAPTKTSMNNTISIVNDLTASAMGGYYQQAGIEHEDNFYDFIMNNTISGPGYNTPTPPGSTYYPASNNILEGIHNEDNNNVTICSNTTTDLNTGFFFGGMQQVTWSNNVMQNEAYGFVLDQYIGWQGSDPSAVTGNQWTASGTYPGWTGINYQTYTTASTTPTLSTMFVNNTTSAPAEDPVNNWGDAGISLSPSMYGLGTGGSGNGLDVATTSTTSVTCNTPDPTMVPPMYMLVAKKQAGYTDNAASRNWIGQMWAWQNVAADTTVDTNAVMHSFKTMAANCRYRHIDSINNAVATGDYSTANALLAQPVGYMASADSDAATGAVLADSAGDAVVSNYRQYYQLLVKYRTDTLSSTDSAALKALAELCPDIDGAIVHHARALYNLVFRDSRLFNDIGCDGAGQVREERRTQSDTTKTGNNTSALSGTIVAQQYTLSPNPSDGRITLKQSVIDINPVQAEIWNNTGERIYQGIFRFTGGITNFDMINKIPGLYLLQLTDSKGNRFVLKFMISGQ